MDRKECTQCRSFLLLKEFYRWSIKKDGRMSECKKCSNKRRLRYRKNNLEKARNQDKKRYKKRRTELLVRQNEYRRNNLEKVRCQDKKSSRTYRLRKKLSKPWTKIESSMRSRIHRALKYGRSSSWKHCLDYTVEELKNHLESKFTEGMSWDNYGYYGWHIDHKIPVSYFNFSSPQDIEFKKCWALDNLQPMWWKENLSKHAKLIYLEGGT